MIVITYLRVHLNLNMLIKFAQKKEYVYIGRDKETKAKVIFIEDD